MNGRRNTTIEVPARGVQSACWGRKKIMERFSDGYIDRLLTRSDYDALVEV
jgi:hypothetical protein